MHRLKVILQYALVFFFLLAGLNHFLHTDFYMRIMPPYLPWHRLLVYVSGLFEIALGIGVAVPYLTRQAAWGLIALLIAVFPANLHMALHADQFPEFNPEMLWLRLPLQAILIGWAYWYTRKDTERQQKEGSIARAL